MPNTATVVGIKTLASASSLHASSPSPCHPLIALSSPSTSSESKVSLYRTTGASDLVWEWINVGEPVTASAAGAGTRGLGLKGKAKAAPVGKVQQLTWSPRGNYLAVAIGPATSTSRSTFAILSVHDGKSLFSSILPLPTLANISHLSWQSFDANDQDEEEEDQVTKSWSIELIKTLPGLPKIVKENGQASASQSGGATAGGGGGPVLGNFAANPGATGGGGGGVFGAKQAMLERERAKEAQRSLNIREAATNGLPTLLSDARTIQGEGGTTGDEKVKTMLKIGRRNDETEKSILCVGDESGKLHLYLGGSVYLGTVDVDGSEIVGIQFLPSLSTTSSTSSNSSTARFLIHTSSNSILSSRHLSLPVPSSLRLVVRQSSALRATIQHAFEALQEVRNLWDESRRIGKGWLQRVTDVSRPQGVLLPPTTQLYTLLMTGRPTRSLHDFLASKMNERGLVKWEQEMSVALDKLKRVGWMSIVPAMERTILLLLEVDAWCRWPDKFATYDFDRKNVLKAIEVAKQVIKSTLKLQGVVEEEERCFKAFSVWLHYELDKLAAQEGSEVRPNAAFHPVPVASFIQDSLSPQTSPLNPFLTMGFASIPIEQNSAITNAQKWVEHGIKLGSKSKEQETLDTILKRLGEELTGQKERESLGNRIKESRRDERKVSIEPPPFAQPPGTSSAADDVRPRTATRPTEDPSKITPPTSIPILLHFVGKLVGDVMSRAMTRMGDTATKLESCQLGEMEEDEENGRKTSRVRSIVSKDGVVYEAWVGKSTVSLARQRVDSLDQVEWARYKLDRNGSPIKVFDMRFIDTDHLVVVAEYPGSTGHNQYITTIGLRSLAFSPDPAVDDSPSLPLDGAVSLDTHFPPSHISISGLEGRHLVCTLAGEGRRLEFHDFASTKSNGDEMEL